MWSFEIENLLKNDAWFMGYYPHDKLPTLKYKANGSIIINTGDSGTEGQHWVALKMTKNKCFYFDSFGLYIVNENIRKFVSKYGKVTYSNICIQDIRSEKCGQFCVAFVKIVNNVKSYNNFIEMFNHSRLYLNDFIVHDLL